MTVPILTQCLLDIEISNDPKIKTLLLNGAKDLARDHHCLFKKKGINIDIFHNDKVQYSGIQLSSHQGSVEWTAIGKDSVKALKLWFKLFKKENSLPLENTVEIKEKYTPEFLSYQKKYYINTFLISDDLARELNDISDKYIRHDRLEKYLYGNFQAFFKHISFEHDKTINFLKISVLKIAYHKKALPVFHQQKKTALSITFLCNFRLPQTIRLGQSTSVGYGRVEHI